MPESRNGAPRRAQNSSSSAPKAGSRSPKHRGYRPAEENPPKKARWNADERASRGHAADRPRGERSERPDWQPREDRGYARDAERTDRFGARPAREDRGFRDDRPRQDRAQRDDRGTGRSFGGDRAQAGRTQGDRPHSGYGRGQDRGFVRNDRFGDRTQRGADRTDRPARTGGYERGVDRPQRGYERTDRFGERPARDDRPARSDRFGDRPARDDRPVRDDRGFRSDRPRRDAGDHAPRSAAGRDRFDERAPRADRFDRPQRADRPARTDRTERAARPDWSPRDDRQREFDDRPRRDSSFYPSKDAHAFSPDDDVVLEKLEAAMTTAAEVDGVSFIDLGLGANIARALAELGAASPFPIQAATIPDVLAGRDVLGRGRTGSGKTIAFGAPLVERILRDGADRPREREAERDTGRRNRRIVGRKPRALILAPTRELALQIDRTVQPIAQSVGLFTTQIYGGVPQARQVGALQRGVDIVIGTPGRIEDLIEQGRLDLSDVQVTVLDEADHMCDLGFLEPVQRIIRRTSRTGQKLLFSATLDSGVAALVQEFLTDPAVHEVAGEDQASSTIDHRVLLIDQRQKAAIIEQLASGEGKTLIFTRTRSYAEQLTEMLDDANIPAVSLHGDLNQTRRTRNLQQLTSGRVNVLVATDVAARGIHVDDISLVIQADAPDEYKTYMHRSGRTGRAGKQGTVVTLVPRNRRRKVDSLLERAEIDAEYTDVVPGDELLDELANIGS